MFFTECYAQSVVNDSAMTTPSFSSIFIKLTELCSCLCFLSLSHVDDFLIWNDSKRQLVVVVDIHSALNVCKFH